jgi:alpha-beta hydrolase superfamily lysophospholipase
MQFLLLSLVLLFFLLIFILYFYAPKLVVKINKEVSTLKDAPGFESNNILGKEIQIKSFDGLLLNAYLTKSLLDQVKGTIILLHGIRSQKELFVLQSKILAQNGFHSIALDLRAHGKSQGQYCTFGVKERRDVSTLIDFLEKENMTNENIVIWGKSLGGAIALQAMEKDKRIKIGIIESTFSDFKYIVHDYCKLFYGFNFWPLTNFLVYRAGKMASFSSEKASPKESCKKIEQPVLMVHGNKDNRINIKYGKENFKNLCSKNKTFLEVQAGDHFNIWELEDNRYYKKIIRFITENKST